MVGAFLSFSLIFGGHHQPSCAFALHVEFGAGSPESYLNQVCTNMNGEPMPSMNENG